LLSNAGVLENRSFNLPIDMLAESGLDYCIKYGGDFSIFDSNYVVLSSDRGWSSVQVNQYLDWVNNGGKLIVLNGDGLGFFAKILSISSKLNGTAFVNKAGNDSSIVTIGNMSVSSLFSRDNAVKEVADYVDGNNQSVPFAFSKEEGRGEIVYLDVNPLFDVLNSANGTSWSYFKEMGGLFNLISLNTPVFQDAPADTRWKYIGYDSTFVRNYVQFNGSARDKPGFINVASNSIIIPYNEYGVDALTLTNTSGTIDGLQISQPLVLQNVTISNFSTKSGLNSTIHSENSSAFLISTNYGSYSCMLLTSPSNISLQVPPEGISFSVNSASGKKNVINLQSGNLLLQNLKTPVSSSILYNLTIPDKIQLDNWTFVLCRTPSIWIWGNTSFSKAYVPNYILSVADDSLNINGTVVFKYDCSSDSVIVLNDFGYSGTPQTGRGSINMTYWEIKAVDDGSEPWNSILISPLFIICIIVLVLLILYIQPFYRRSFSVKIGKGRFSFEVQRKKNA
jgi:hypothetical protein